MEHLSRPLPVFAIATAFALIAGCDAESDPADSEAPENVVGERDEPLKYPEGEPGSGLITVSVDGVSEPERILASIETEDGTKIYFVKEIPPDDEQFAVDVVIVGPDGGFDYGSLVGPGKSTPLELYLALTDESTDPPAELVEAHDWEVEATGRDPLGDLRIPELPDPEPLQSHGPGQNNDDDTTGKSTYTCLSWSNFLYFLSIIHPDETERWEDGYWVDTGYNERWQYVGLWWAGGEQDEVVCNYDSSSSSSYHDYLYGWTCHQYNISNPATHCVSAYLDDGYYLRRVYGYQTSYRTYYVASQPSSQTSLLSFLGLVHNN